MLCCVIAVYFRITEFSVQDCTSLRFPSILDPSMSDFSVLSWPMKTGSNALFSYATRAFTQPSVVFSKKESPPQSNTEQKRPQPNIPMNLFNQYEKREIFETTGLPTMRPRINPKLLMKQPLKSLVMQPIPPSFTPTDPDEYLINGRKENRTEKEFLSSKSVFLQMKYFKQLDAMRNQTLYRLRRSMNLTVPYTEEELRQAAQKSTNETTVWVGRPRFEFYTADPKYYSGLSPMLMDGFTYCEDETLVVEALFNLKYMYVVSGRNKTRISMTDTWICTHAGQTETNFFRPDPDKHIIITEFKFKNQCSTASDPHYEIRSIHENHSYALDLEFLPDFRAQRFYLSLCVFLENAPLAQVMAFINHHFFHGVQHFVFYINGNLPYWEEVLKAYITHGIIDLVDFTLPYHRPFYEQQVMMNSCNRRYRYTTQFMIFCDVDEFFLPVNPDWRVVDVVRLYDLAYPNVDGFSVRFSSIPDA